MREKYLLQLAIKMLEATNPYNKPIQDFRYSYSNCKEKTDVSLFSRLESELQGKHRSFRSQKPAERDYAVCYEAIEKAMIWYVENYIPPNYSFLQETKIKFSGWLKSIAKTYGVVDQVEPDAFQVKSQDRDTAIAMLKALHPRKRVTVNEISDQMGISVRAVQKNLKRLDPAWNTDSAGVQEAPFRIGGQPIEVKLDTEQPKTGKATLYRTTNTVHPLVLLENQMQVGTLLKSLAHTYCAEDSYVCYSIGLDIWSQLSEYSRERVKTYFAFHDEKLQTFIEDLENAVPGNMAYGFQTERDMVERLGAISFPINELLLYALKGEGRQCNIVLKKPDGSLFEMACCKLTCRIDENGGRVYIAYSPCKGRVEFREEDVEDIEI